MPGIGNNLYPPIISTYMPAFVRNTECRIYFSLSNYNSIKDIKNVQVVISNQNTNLSALAPGKYPTGIKFATLQIDNKRVGDDKYYITIYPSDLQSGIFELNQYYKVQIRFTGVGATDLSGETANWLVENQAFFSEWSTVCLIRGIEQPKIYLKGFEDTKEQEAIFTSEVIEFVGSMYYEQNAEIEKEYLKSYRIKIYKVFDDTLVYDSEDVYTNTYNPNEINYTLKTALEDGTTYKITFTYNTVNEYTNNVSYTFLVIQNVIDSLDATIAATPEEDIGRIKIDIVATITEDFFGNLTIKRTSNKSDFTIWEDVHNVTIAEGEPLNYTWYDYTIESGVWYQYCAHKRNSKGDRGAVVKTRHPVMAVFDDMFLTRGDMQIRLKYDPQISSFKKTMLESKTDTLGSKYPIIRRNGNVGYRQFPISGLITAFCDEEGIFINRENLYGNAIIYYDNYNDVNDINEYQDFVYERKFREKVMDFLHANTIKLFRSTTEGNILVRLMDISFTPNQTLGRMLYTFNATAYEIDDCSLSNFEKYGIQSVGAYSNFLQHTFSILGQLQGIYNGQNILDVLQDKYANRTTEKYISEVKSIKWLRLEFNSPPYLIKTAAGGSIEPLPEDETPTENTILGYIVHINNKPIIVSPRGFYELIDKDTDITSVIFPVGTEDVTIDYIVNIEQLENPELLYKKMYFYTKVGQMGDTFDINENVFLKIYLKYLSDYSINNTKYHQELLSINKMTIEAIPGTIVYIKDSFDQSSFKHEIGSTGVLEFYEPDTTIVGLRFCGVQLYEAKEKKENEIKENEFKEIAKDINDVNEIVQPVNHGVYEKPDGSRYIYYRNNWYEFSSDNIVQCPVDALIDYIYESMKGERE